MKKEKRFKSIQMKIVLYFVILFSVISLITGVVQYKFNWDGQFQNARDDVAKLASASALLVDGDGHEKLVNKKDQSSEIYKEIRSKMIEFTEKTDVTGVYTLVKVGNEEINVIIDGYENPVDIGYEYQYLPEMTSAFEGNPSSAEDLRTDEWGTVLQGYAPIENTQGEIVGIMVVDLDASYIIQQKRQLSTILFLGSLFGLIFMVVLSTFISRNISKPIRTLADGFNELSNSKDLTKRIEIKTGDEIELLSNAINRFIESVREIVIQTKNAGEDVATSADALNISIHENQAVLEEVNSAIGNIASGATDQATDITDISYGIQEISKDMDENESKVIAINDATGQTRNLINNGIEAVNNQSIKTDENMESFQKVTRSVQKLAKEIEDIEKILSTIVNISEQTNLLALNAAIEAARAGENGKGFAVVAEEVRELAEQSAMSTTEIEQILQNINKDAGEAVDQIEKSNLIAQEQKEAVDSTSLIFNQITKEVESVIASIGVINTSFKVIGDNTNNVSNKVQNVSAVSQENAAISEEVSASSEEQNTAMQEIATTTEELNNLSDNLKNIISTFKI